MTPRSHSQRRLFRKRLPASGRRCRRQPVLECLEARWVLSGGYSQVNLASDVPGLARTTDPNLINPWGIAFSPTGPFWFADNGSGVSDLLDGRGQPVPLHVTTPFTAESAGTPTGVVFNAGPGFLVSENGASAPGRLLFATEEGTIAGWTAVVDWTHALVALDNSSSGAVYKGLALATDPTGQSFLYVADFGRGTIDVFDQNFKPVARPGAFQDPDIPEGYAPFNIQNIRDQLFVTYAQRNKGGRDDIAGAGHGFVDIYDSAGNLLKRFASQGALDSPWGLALAPASFGPFGGDLLIGNNGDGHINAYDPAGGAFLGTLSDADGIPVTLPSLWALTFGNDHMGGASNTLFFTAGLDDETHGLFGAIQAPGREGADTAGPGTFDPHAAGEPGDYPLPPSTGPSIRDNVDESELVTAVLLPSTESSLVLIPTLTTVAGRIDRPVPIMPVGAISSQAVAGTAPLIARSTLFFSPNGDAPPPNHGDFLALNTFLDLNVAQRSADPDAGERLDWGTRSVLAAADADALSPLTGMQIAKRDASPQGQPTPDPFVLSREGDNAAAPVASIGRRQSISSRVRRDQAVQTSKRRSLTGLLEGFLIVLSVPVIHSVCQGRRPGDVKQSSILTRRVSEADRCPR